MNILNNLQFIAFRTIVLKEIIRVQRLWRQTVFPPIVTMSLYFILFGNLLGRRIGLVLGISYIKFIVPGLVMMSVIQNAYANTSSSLFGEKFGRSIEELLVSPVKNPIIVLSYTIGSIYRCFITGTLVILVSLYFTHLHLWHIGIMLLTVLLTAVLFSLAGFINALFAKKFDDIGLVPAFILTPLTYLGGVFYPISRLRGIWHKIALMNPIVYVVQAFRYGMIGIESQGVYQALGIILGCDIFLFLVCVYCLKLGVGLRS